MLLGRWSHFKSNKMHYFLLDFCYTVILLSLVHVHFLYRESYSETLFKMCFILSTGPPAAIPLWKNSLVFHDFDKITSVYIHFLPTCLYYCLRESKGAHSVTHYDDLRVVDYFNCMLFYFTWQVFYLFKTEVSDKAKLESDPALLTSLKWLSSNQENKLSKSVLVLCRKLRLFGPDEPFSSTSMKTKMVFVTTQLLFTMVAMIPTYHLWRNSTAHLIYIALIFALGLLRSLLLRRGLQQAVHAHWRRRLTRPSRVENEQVELNASLSQSISGGRLDQGAGVNSIPPAARARGCHDYPAAGQEEDFEGTDVVEGTDSFDDYEEEFSLNNIWDEDEADYMLI